MDIHDELEYIIEKHETLTGNLAMQIYDTELKIELHLILSLGVILNFQHLKQWNDIEALRIRQLKIKMVKMKII